MRDDEGDVTRDMETASRTDDQPAAARRPAARKSPRDAARGSVSEPAGETVQASSPMRELRESPRPEDELPEAEIRERAYELYRMRGGADGFDQADWYAAEQEIRSRPLREPPDARTAPER